MAAASAGISVLQALHQEPKKISTTGWPLPPALSGTPTLPLPAQRGQAEGRDGLADLGTHRTSSTVLGERG